MKLISLNVALFEKNNEKLKSFLEKENPDIICLQEVTRTLDTTINHELVSKDTIDSATEKLTFNFFAPIWALSKFEKFDFHGKDHFLFELGGMAEFGNYVKSKYPIIKGQNVFVQNHFSYVTDWSKWPEEDYRAFQVVDTKINGSNLRLINYHGIWSKDKRGTEKTRKACEIINAVATEIDYPVIICGDFNLFPGTDSIAVFKNSFISLVDKFGVKTTRPESNELSNEKRNVVDYVFVNKGVKVNKFEVIDSQVSDHLPLVLDFEI